MNRRSLTFVCSLLAGTILSAQATPPHTIEDLDKILPDIEQYKSVPAPQTFHSNPSRTAAGVLHYAIDPTLGPVILLGHRNDEDTYCNLGGKSDKEEGKAKGIKTKKKETLATVDETATREVDEESNGYYAHHSYDLESKPFIDVLRERENKKPLLYRMYWKKVQKVDGDLLLKALKKGKDDHNKEYKGFVWVPVKAVLETLENENQTIKLDDNKQITLFEPLYQTLSTDSGVIFLKSIATKGNISRFKKEMRPFHNRLYVIAKDEDNSSDEDSASDKKEVTSNKKSLEHAEFKIHWELPSSIPLNSNYEVAKVKSRLLNESSESEQLEKYIKTKNNTEVLGSKKRKKHYEIQSYDLPLVPFGKNAWGEDYQTLKINGFEQTKIPLSAEKDEKDFAQAVAAHGAAMVEIKRKAGKIQSKAKIKENKDTSSESPSVQGWNPNADLTLSRIHLRIVLGKEFKKADDFKKALKPQRAADIENLRAYLTKYKDVENTQKKS